MSLAVVDSLIYLGPSGIKAHLDQIFKELKIKLVLEIFTLTSNMPS